MDFWRDHGEKQLIAVLAWYWNDNWEAQASREEYGLEWTFKVNLTRLKVNLQLDGLRYQMTDLPFTIAISYHL